MPRRAKHPALALKNLERRSVSEVSEIFETTAYKKQDLLSRSFLANYIYHRDYKKAAMLSGVSLEWLAEREEDAEFLRIVQEVLDHPVQLGLSMVVDMVPHSVVELASLIDQDDNKTVKLNAIKHLHYIAGMMPEPDEEAGGNTQFNISVQMWNKTLDAPGGSHERAERIIEGKRK